VRVAARRPSPWWEPGYHAITQGYLISELVRRISGRSLGSFFAEEVAGPIGADFHIGLGPSHFDRVSNVIPPPPLELPADRNSLAVRSGGGDPDGRPRRARQVIAGVSGSRPVLRIEAQLP
jgi:CubicO group peptidase (beta-lactamase class C family)